MIIRKDILRFWAAFSVILALALGGITLVFRWHRIFPSDEVSDIYAKYAEREDVEVTFVKGYCVNDTILVDITLLEAKDTTAWEELCKDFDIVPLKLYPEEYRQKIISPTSYCLKVVKDTLYSDNDCHRRDIIIFSYLHKTMCAFQNIDDNQYEAILANKTQEITY